MASRSRKRILESSKFLSGKYEVISDKYAGPSNLAAALPASQKKSFAELKSETVTTLQALKKDMDHEHVYMQKATESHTGKIKKRVKQECQEASQMSKAIETDWKNFLADFDEDAKENQDSINKLLHKAQKAAAHFTEFCIPELMKRVDNRLNELRTRSARPQKSRRVSVREKGKAIEGPVNARISTSLPILIQEVHKIHRIKYFSTATRNCIKQFLIAFDPQ